MTTSSMQVGVTGGIGSGKSLVCKIFSTLWSPCLRCWIAVQGMLWQTTPSLIQQIKEVLGSDAYFKEGKINRKYISELVFADDGKRERRLIALCIRGLRRTI